MTPWLDEPDLFGRFILKGKGRAVWARAYLFRLEEWRLLSGREPKPFTWKGSMVLKGADTTPKRLEVSVDGNTGRSLVCPDWVGQTEGLHFFYIHHVSRGLLL